MSTTHYSPQGSLNRRSRFTRHESELGWWVLAVGEPHAALRPYIREYIGGLERTTIPICRRESPTEIAPLVINFGAPSRFFDPLEPERWADYGSFATGPYDSYVLVGSTGPLNCLQINFTVLGARLFLGRPLSELTNRPVALEDLLGPTALQLRAELYDATAWEQRFAILDHEIMRRISAAKGPAPAVLWSWQRLIASGGRVSIGSLVKDVGWSRKHLIAQFTEQLGLRPKVLARLIRFGRAIEQLKTAPQVHLVDIANDCGYYDQAHFSRDFRVFAGITPIELMRSQLPDNAGFSGDW